MRNALGQIMKGSTEWLGRKHSISTRKKMRKVKLEKPTRYWLGKKHTPEHIKKMVVTRAIKGVNYYRVERIKKVCKNCLEQFTVKPSAPKQKFCKPACATSYNSGVNHTMWKGGNNQYYTRRKMALKNGGSHTPKDWEELKEKFNYMCLCCKRYEPEIKLSKDHIQPLSKGGSNEISNIQPLCQQCNSRKHDKEIDFISHYQIN